MVDDALLVAQFDAVIGVDASALHAAAAMNKPAMVALGSIADWCWPIRSTTTRWYPTAVCTRSDFFDVAAAGEWLQRSSLS